MPMFAMFIRVMSRAVSLEEYPAAICGVLFIN